MGKTKKIETLIVFLHSLNLGLARDNETENFENSENVTNLEEGNAGHYLQVFG